MEGLGIKKRQPASTPLWPTLNFLVPRKLSRSLRLTFSRLSRSGRVSFLLISLSLLFILLSFSSLSHPLFILFLSLSVLSWGSLLPDGFCGCFSPWNPNLEYSVLSLLFNKTPRSGSCSFLFLSLSLYIKKRQSYLYCLGKDSLLASYLFFYNLIVFYILYGVCDGIPHPSLLYMIS